MKVEEKLIMNPQIQPESVIERVNTEETIVTDAEALTHQGFNEDEVISLLWLRQWYQHGGSDRVEVIRHLEFLKQQILEGKITL